MLSFDSIQGKNVADKLSQLYFYHFKNNIVERRFTY